MLSVNVLHHQVKGEDGEAGHSMISIIHRGRGWYVGKSVDIIVEQSLIPWLHY